MAASTHTHGAIITAGASPDINGGSFIIRTAGPTGKPTRTQFGFFTTSGIQAYKVGDESQCPSHNSGSAGIVAGFSDSVQQCPDLDRMRDLFIALAKATSDTRMEQLLISKPTVQLLDGRPPAAKSDPSEYEWTYLHGQGWRHNPGRGTVDLSGFAWGAVPAHLEEMIPAIDPYYVVDQGLFNHLTYVSFVAPPPRVSLVMGSAGSGKDKGHEQFAASVGAPYLEITVEEGTSSNKLIISDTLSEGSGGVRLGPVAEFLGQPCIVNLAEANHMPEGQNVALRAIMTARPGQKIPLTATQGSVLWERDGRSVLGMTQNQGHKHPSIHSQGAALRRRARTYQMRVDEKLFRAAATARLDAMLATTTVPPGAIEADIHKAARESLEEVFLPLALAARLEPDMIERLDVSPFVTAAAAHAVPFLGHQAAFMSEFVTQPHDPADQADVLRWVVDDVVEKWAEPFKGMSIVDADI